MQTDNDFSSRLSKVGQRTSSLDFENSYGVLAYPYCFNDRTSREDIAKLPYLGTKLTSMVRQWLLSLVSELDCLLRSRNSSRLERYKKHVGYECHTPCPHWNASPIAEKFLSSTRFLTLSAFNSIHGIGPHTARHLYSLGLRSIEDLQKYYEVTPGITDEGAVHLEPGTSKEIGVEKSIKVSLALQHDFSQK